MIGGIVRDHDVDRSDAEDVWAFLRGTSDLLHLVALSVPELGAEEASRDERMTVSLGRALDMASRAAGEDGIEGPNPRANDLRVAGRRHFRRPDRSKPLRDAPPFDESTALDRMKQLTETLVRAQDSLPDRLTRPEMKAAARDIAASMDAVFAGVGMLSDRGRDDDLFACLREGFRRARAVNESLETAESLADIDRAGPAMADYDEFRDCYLAFIQTVAKADGADAAERTLDRLMASVLTN
jgi:hypothetical protein